MSNFSAVDANNGNLVDMFGTFMEIGGVHFSDNQKAKTVCKIADDNGVSHKVHLYQGKGQLPTPAQLQQRHSFSISTFQGTFQGTPYTGYSGFWNNKAQVNQQSQPATQQSTAPPQPQQGTQQARQPVKPKEPDWDAIAEGKVRHGLVCAYIQGGLKLSLEDLEKWKTYIMTGHHPDNVAQPDSSIVENPGYGEPSPEDPDPPF